MVSDGSLKNEHGTAAWKIESENSIKRIVGLTFVSSFPIDQSAYISELAGLYSIIRVITIIVEVWQMEVSAVTIICDGLSALDKSFEVERLITLASQSCDLLSGIQGMIRPQQIDRNYVHVKRH